jgi:hypothetical protein
VFGIRRRSGRGAVQPRPGAVDLLSLFRLSEAVHHPTINAVARDMFRATAIRPSSGVFSQINQSAWQPVNVPAVTMVDLAPEYMPPWPFNGDAAFLERQGYSQDPLQGQMVPRPSLPYSLVTPPYQTLPWLVNVGGTNG